MSLAGRALAALPLVVTLFAATANARESRLTQAEAAPALDRPNIVFIMADDMGFADLSSYGRSDYETPNLDRLAREGMRFTDAYAIAPTCSPTRVGFMTGRYPARSAVGLWEPLGAGQRELGLATDPPTLSMRLKAAGYYTGWIGKWHLGELPKFRPPEHGFDVSFGPLMGMGDYVSHVYRSPLVSTEPRHDLYANGDEVFRDGYMTDLLTEEAIAFLRTAEPPFFLSLQYTAPHSPWQKRGDGPYPEDWHWIDDGGSPEIYGEMVRALDEGVARVLEALKELGYEQKTLVIFTSDNGGDRWSDMGPFRGRKLDLWEGGIRVPAFARWPGSIAEDSTTDQVATTLDWTATILSAAGASASASASEALDGMDLLPQLKGEAASHDRTLFWRTYQHTRHKAVRSGAWKYLRIDPIGEDDRDVAGEYLFDLARDPGEARNLKAENPDVFARLKASYAAWEASVLEPIALRRR